MNDHPSDEELGGLAVTLARGAAEVVRDGRRTALEVTSKSTATDLVTVVDRRSEAWLIGELARLRPDDGVLGEEGGARPGRTGVRWLLDPVDGTVNFVLGIPHYAVSVAAEVDGQVRVGAVCDVALGETFRAVLGGGAYLDDAPLGLAQNARDVPLAAAVVGTGFGYDRDLRRRQGAAVAALLPDVADVRRLGSAALALCYVAAGRLDGYFEAGLHEWDYAAGALVATEAGCVVAGRDGRPAPEFTTATRPALAAPLAELLARTGADAVL